MYAETLVPNPAVERFDETVFHRLAWANEVERDPPLTSPGVEVLARELGAVVQSDELWLGTLEAEAIERRCHLASDDGKDIRALTARASREYTSMTVSTRNRRPLISASLMKSMAHCSFRRVGFVGGTRTTLA
jgi:hypothetical protein